MAEHSATVEPAQPRHAICTLAWSLDISQLTYVVYYMQLQTTNYKPYLIVTVCVE